MIPFVLGTLVTFTFILFFIDREKTLLIKKIGLVSSSFTFLLSMIVWVTFDNSTTKLQFARDTIWLSSGNINFTLGLDGVSLFFILLTTLLILVCLLISWDVEHFVKEFFIAFLVLEVLLILVFSVADLFLFYVFFESVLIPMYLIIGIWGSRERKVRAAFLFFLYTLFGSLVMLLAISYIYIKVGTTDYEVLLTHDFTKLEQKIIWLALFASFASKVPMIPLHLWLPEAHVEAPTAGSVVLAGILLKLGIYGILRFLLPLFPSGSYFFVPIVNTFSIAGIIFASLTAIRQLDLKRIIAYTSIAHMNLVVMGLFSFNLLGFEGGIIQSISHGFVSSALFLIIGAVYERYHTRLVKYFGGLVHLMPLFVAIFLFFSLANIALPGTSSFVGEFLIFSAIFKSNSFGGVFCAFSMVLGGAYSLWLFTRISYGNFKLPYLERFQDLTKKEFFVFLPLILGTVIIGIYPQLFFGSLHASSIHLTELTHIPVHSEVAR